VSSERRIFLQNTCGYKFKGLPMKGLLDFNTYVRKEYMNDHIEGTNQVTKCVYVLSDA